MESPRRIGSYHAAAKVSEVLFQPRHTAIAVGAMLRAQRSIDPGG